MLFDGTHSSAYLLQCVLVDGIAQLHFAVQRVLLIVADEVYEAVKLRGAQHHGLTFLLHAAVLYLSLCPVREQQSLLCQCIYLSN